MNVLIIGHGGREHSICWAVSQNPKCNKVYCAPGSDGIAQVAICVSLSMFDGPGIIDFCKNKSIDLVIIGPEGPLEYGLADELTQAGILTFGPSKSAAKLESSKIFTKEICKACNVPTAEFNSFTSFQEAVNFISNSSFPIVIKRNGLASGKGVSIVEDEKQAIEILKSIFVKNSKSEKILIEKFIQGEEASLFVITDGIHYLSLGGAQDYKRLRDGDLGPNTGGMGAFSPTPVLSKNVEEIALKKIIEPTIKEMTLRGTPFKGILYAGLMVSNGDPNLIEYNVRFGDPECQVLMMRLGGQILDIILNCVKGKLKNTRVNWANDHALTVVLASKGYPEKYKKGSQIKNLSRIEEDSNLRLFHAGTKKVLDTYYSDGGRVLNVTARGKNLKQARDKVYKAISKINWDESSFRKDIGLSSL